MERESKEYSWAYVTVDRLLTNHECELVYAYLVPSGATTNSAIYDGTNTTGTQILDFKSAVVTGHPFKPPVPVYCRSGLYVDVGTSVTGIFVMWRHL